MPIRKLKKLLKIVQVVDTLTLLRFLITPEKNFKGNVAGRRVWVRPRTTDLKVAVDSLTDEFDSLASYSSGKNITLVVDAGGYIGTAAIRLAELFPDAQILSIEASEKNYAMLVKNTKQHKNILPIKAALSEKAGETLQMYSRGTGNWGLTALKKANVPKNAKFLHQVPTTSLSSLVASYGTIDLLKIDIEGGEYAVFRGDAATLQDIPLIFAELHDRIVPGCTDAFLNIPGDRKMVNLGGEKLLSMKHPA